MPKKELIELAEQLERHLGDPHTPDSRMSFSRVLETDEREQYPYTFVNMLQRWGIDEYLLPEEQGGRARDLEVGFNLMRLIARRDPTSAAALMLNHLGLMPALIAGTEAQKREIVAGVKEGRRGCWGLSERHHGSDLIANELRAEKTEGGYLLTGEKWLIGIARHADDLSVYARTDDRGGPGGYSVFVLDKRSVSIGSLDELPDERLHGLRGLDVSGFRLDRAFVSDSALLGREGQGLEIALLTSQVARALVTGIALSAVDTALRVTLDFTESRTIFGRAVSDIPYSRRQLVECFADLMIADAVSLGAVRSLQVVPEQSSVWSSVVKYFVPTLLERTMSQLNVVLGARFYLRAHPHYGIHQKMVRDLPVTNFADGNTAVNLKNLALQLDGLLDTAVDAGDLRSDAASERVKVLFGIDRALPPFRPWEQRLSAKGLDDCLIGAEASLRLLLELAGRAKGEEQVLLRKAAEVAAELLGGTGGFGGIRGLRERVTALRDRLGREYGQSAELFDLAKEYALMHTVAACVHTHVHSREALDDPLPNGALLLLQLERLRRHLRLHEGVTDSAVVDEVMRVLRRFHQENRLFSYWQFPLAARGDLAAAST